MCSPSLIMAATGSSYRWRVLPQAPAVVMDLALEPPELRERCAAFSDRLRPLRTGSR